MGFYSWFRPRGLNYDFSTHTSYSLYCVVFTTLDEGERLSKKDRKEEKKKEKKTEKEASKLKLLGIFVS